MTELFDILIPHWEAHQNNSDENDLSIEARVKRIQKDLDEHALAVGLKGMNLTRDDNSSLSLLQQQFAQSLIKFVDCAIASVIQMENGSKEAVEAILELTAAVSATDVLVCRAVLKRTIRLSETQVDNVRMVACRTIGWIVHYIMQQNKIPISDYNKVLDAASQALLPRFTDKSQPVRLAAIQAGGHFFVGDATDPDLLQAMLWCLQHDPSVANREAALDSLPITLETIDFVVQRIRDIKPKVRVAALNALLVKCKDLSLLEPIQCAAVIEAGYTGRCSATKEATERLVCLGWMKLVQYNPIELLRHLNVVEHDTVSDIVASILVKAARDESMLVELSDPEIRAFRQSIQDAMVSLSDQSNDDEEDTLTAESLFLSVAAYKHAATPREQESVLNQLVPDMSVLCEVLGQETGKLIQAIQQEDTQEEQDKLVSVCSQLLQLAVLADLEEGSRRLLSTALQRLLVSVLTPDDLIEDAVKALQSVCRDDTSFIGQVADIMRELDNLAEQNIDLSTNYKLRSLSILTVLFELSDPKLAGNETLVELSNYVLPVLEHTNPLVREAAVSCIGKLGLFMHTTTIEDDWEPLLLKISSDNDEKDEIRAQAMLGLSDWSLVHDIHPTFAASISQSLTRSPSSKALACIAAEIAAKLLLSGKANNQEWLASLVVNLFDPEAANDSAEEEIEQADIKQVGSPVRLHQILTVFFPAYSLKHNLGENLIGCVPVVLDLVQQRQQSQKKTRTRKSTGRKSSKATWPIAKIVEYIVSTCEHARAASNEAVETAESVAPLGDADKSQKRKVFKSSPALLTAIQVSGYLVEKTDDIGATFRGALCKWLGSVFLDFEIEEPRHLLQLKKSVDELEMALSDKTSKKSLSGLMELLANVSDAESEDEEQCQEEQQREESSSDDETESLESSEECQASIVDSSDDEQVASLVDAIANVELSSVDGEENAVQKAKSKSSVRGSGSFIRRKNLDKHSVLDNIDN